MAICQRLPTNHRASVISPDASTRHSRTMSEKVGLLIKWALSCSQLETFVRQADRSAIRLLVKLARQAILARPGLVPARSVHI